MIVGKEQQTWDICARHCNSHWTLTPTTESGASWVRNTLPNGNERVNGHTFAPVLLEKPTDGSLTRLLDAASEAGLRVHVVERSEERQHFSPKQLETLWLEVETPSWPG